MNFRNDNIKEKLKQIKSKDKYENIKSDYFIQKVFDNLQIRKKLEIIKYNKNIQKRIHINVNDYKEYSEIYSLIELEIKPVNNISGKFINISEENKKYFHIYFDNNKEEVERYYLYRNEQIKSIKVIIDYQVKLFYKLFYGCNCIESISFTKFYRNNITNMSGMFFWCSSLKEINLTKFITNNVTNMRCMFFWCSSLKELNLSNFNTNNVTNMEYMFNGCVSLKELNLSNFDTYNVINMSFMFYKCLSLEELNLSNFNTNNVTNMKGMFSGCSDELKIKIKSRYNNLKEEAFHDENLI